jgi:hypothetical protein
MIVRQLFDEKMETCQRAIDFVEQLAMDILATLCNPPLMPLKEIQSNPRAKISPRQTI